MCLVVNKYVPEATNISCQGPYNVGPAAPQPAKVGRGLHVHGRLPKQAQSAHFEHTTGKSSCCRTQGVDFPARQVGNAPVDGE